MCKKVFVVLIFLLIQKIAFSAVEMQANPKRYVISDFGARGDGAFVCTRAIQAAIDKCSGEHGGVVVIPEGVFLSGAIFIKLGVSLRVEKEGVLKGTTNIDDYPAVRTRWEGQDREWTAALINAFDVSNIELAGEGTIDGSGDEWTVLFLRNPARRPADPATGETASSGATHSSSTSPVRRGRPRLIALQNCRDVRVSKLHLKNQASWGLFMVYSENITAEDLVIRAEHNIPSSDGMDIDSCRRVHVVGCDIDVNDDCISIKSGKDEEGRRANRPAEDILIEKTRFGYGHGGVAMGSEVSGGIRNVEVRDCIVEAGNWAPVRFKSQPSRGGVLENIVYRNIEIRDARQAVEVQLEWRLVPPLAPAAPKLTMLENVRFIHLVGKVASVGILHGYKDTPLTGLKFEDCHLSAQHGLTMENVGEVDTSGLSVEVKEGPALVRREAVMK